MSSSCIDFGPVVAVGTDEPETVTPDAVHETSVLGLAELLLKESARVDRMTHDEAVGPRLIPSFLAIALSSFSLFALALAVLLFTAPDVALPVFLTAQWTSHPFGAAIALWLAYTVGLIAATGVCLPSFYFYALLSGVRVTWPQVTTIIMKGKASTAVLLMGVLPIYVAVVLGLTIFGADMERLRFALYVGVGLPFLAGLWGVRQIYGGFQSLAETLPTERRCRRECFLRRLTLACAACYSAVTPVMIYTLWNSFSEQLAALGL
jgi:hypothetical protein